MSEDYGNDFITIEDEEGNEFTLEHLDTMEYKGKTYMAFLPADIDEDDEEFGIILLSVVEDENGDELLESIDDDDELDGVYEAFMEILFDDEEDGHKHHHGHVHDENCSH